MKEKKVSPVFKGIKWLVKVFYPKYQVIGAENIPLEDAIIVGNHCQIHGPVAGVLYVPGQHYIWCAGEMMNRKEVPDYAYQDFWSGKPKLMRPFYRVLSYIIAPFAQFLFRNADTIAVYHDARIMNTFKQTVQRLQEGNRVVIFPEHYVTYNHIVCEFQDRFVDVARLYYRQTKKELSFVPMYLAPTLKQMHFGTPIRFCADRPIEEERQRIAHRLMEEITQIAVALPVHKVVPYENVGRKFYPSNRLKEQKHEKTCG